jgi:hypothetical protein
MVTRLGTTLGTLLGTDLGQFTENPPPAPFDPTKLYALSDFSAANYFDSQAGGGEVGDATTGFGAFYLLQCTGVPTTTQILYNNAPVAGPFAGHTLQAAANVLRGTAYRDTATNTLTPSRSVTGTDAGRLIVYGYAFDPGASRLRGYADRGEYGNATTMATYVPGTLSSRLGVYRDLSLPTTSFRVLGWLTYRGVLSSPNLLALFDAFRTASDAPASITGATLTHRWSLRETLAATSPQAVVDGAAAPSVIPDSVTSAPVDAMARTGAPTVRIIDPSVEGRVSYGALGFSTTSYFETAVSQGIVGSASGFFVAYRFGVPFTSAADVLVSRENVAGTSGYSVYVGTTTVSFLVANGSGYVVATCPVPAGHRAITVLCRYSGGTGGTARIAVDGVEGSAVALSGTFAALPSQVMRVGAKSPNGLVPAATSTFFAVSGGDLPVSDAEAATFWSQVSAGAALPRIAGKTQHEYDVTQDVVANGGPSAGAPATVLDRVGTDHLTRVGTGLVATQRTERLWTYETTPIGYGSGGHTDAAYYENATGGIFPGSTSGFWVAYCFTPTVYNVAASRHIGSSSTTGATGGWQVNSSNNTSILLSIFDDTGVARSAPLGVYATTDIGKVCLYVGVVDTTNLRLRSYWKRAEVSTGTAITGYRLGTQKYTWGRGVTAGVPATDLTVLGFQYGLGIPTLAQVQALYDAVAANDGRMQPIPGMTTSLYDVTLDAAANGNVIPATLTDRVGAVPLTRVGSPTTIPQYNRAMTW